MGYQKTILCLAASRRPGGRCIAGKEIQPKGAGSWIRPIGPKDDAIRASDGGYKDGSQATLLDKIRISFVEPKPDGFQSENHLIVDKSYWVKVGTATWEEVVAAIDPEPGPLWVNKFSTYHGHNDKVMEADTGGLKSSLLLVRPDKLEISVGSEKKFSGGVERHVRASFYLNDTAYKLMVTDPMVEKEYFRKEDGSYPIKEAILCVSLTKIFHGAAIKLVAAVISPKTSAMLNR